MRDIEVDVMGHKLRIKEDGEGRPLLFLHGAGGSNWSPLLKQLATHRRVLAPEHPGFGRSATPDWMMSVGDLAFFYLDAFEKLGLEDFDLLGHSMGGWTAAEIAIRNTSRLRSLCLMAPAGVADKDVPFGDIFLWSGEEAARNQTYDQKIAEERIKALPNTDLDVALQNKATVARLAWSPRLHNPQLPHWLHRIDVPTLLLWGREDRIIPHVCHKQFLAEIPGATLVTLTECGHAIHTEKAIEADNALKEFYGGLGQ